MMHRCVLSIGTISIALLSFPSTTVAQCESHASPEIANMYLIPAVYSPIYTICYDSRFADDLGLVNHWVSQSIEIAKSKYNILTPTDRQGNELKVTVFLPSEPTHMTRRGVVSNTCCWSYGNSTAAEMHYLTPSAWGDPPYGGLSYENLPTTIMHIT